MTRVKGFDWKYDLQNNSILFGRGKQVLVDFFVSIHNLNGDFDYVKSGKAVYHPILANGNYLKPYEINLQALMKKVLSHAPIHSGCGT
jgi:hypothetical protein